MCCLHFGVSWEKIGDHPEPASGSTGSEKMPPAKTHSGESTHEYPREVCENLYGWRSRAGAPRIPPIWSRSPPRLASAQSSQEATHTEWQAGRSSLHKGLTHSAEPNLTFTGRPEVFYFIFKPNFCYKEDAAILQFFFKMSFLFPLQKEKCFCASHCPILCTTTLPAAIETLPQVFCWAPLMAGTPFLLLTITPALISGMFAYIS